MPSVCVRLIDGATNKIILWWSFVDIRELCFIYMYGDLLEDIIAGKYEHCLIEVKCKNICFTHGLSSTSHKLLEEVQGCTTTDILEKLVKFGMLYFTLHVVHNDDSCSNCRDKINVSPAVQMHSPCLFLVNSLKKAYQHHVQKSI